MYTILHSTATELRFKKHHDLTMSNPYFKGEQVTSLLFQGGFVVDVTSTNARLRSNLQKIYEPADALKTLSYYTVDAVLTAAKMIYDKHHTYNKDGFITEIQTILAKKPEVGDFSSLKKFFEDYEKPTEFISSIQEALALPAVPTFWYWRMFFAVKIYKENQTKSEDPRVESPYSEGQVLELDVELTQRIYVSASAVPHYRYEFVMLNTHFVKVGSANVLKSLGEVKIGARYHFYTKVKFVGKDGTVYIDRIAKRPYKN